MSKLTILAVIAAVAIGVAHGLLAAMWDYAVDDGEGPYPKGYPIP